MSTLTVTNISNGSSTTTTANVVNGCAKAWVNFNGNTPAARASYNVSSITSLGAGHYRVNFTNSLADTNYAVVATCCFNTTSATTGNDFMQASNFTTASFDCASKVTTSGVLENVAQIGVAIFR